MCESVRKKLGHTKGHGGHGVQRSTADITDQYFLGVKQPQGLLAYLSSLSTTEK